MTKFKRRHCWCLTFFPGRFWESFKVCKLNDLDTKFHLTELKKEYHYSKLHSIKYIFYQSQHILPSTLRLQRKAPLTTLLSITPPIRHRYNLPTPKDQKDQQHIQIEPGIKSSSKDIIIPRPESISISESPKHHNEGSNPAREVARANVTIKCAAG